MQRDGIQRREDTVTGPTLIVMAAGIGSRYGGLKQMDPVGPGGEVILDYTAYDAIKAGFAKIVFVVSRDLEPAFRERFGPTLGHRVNVAYVLQELTDLPPGFKVPEERIKPWGTGHAVLSCRNEVEGPFAVVNADDYYGPTAFESLSQYLHQAEDQNGIYDFCMVGYQIANTLSESGAVARGVCEMTPDGYLMDVRERTRVQRRGAEVAYEEEGDNWVVLPPDTIVSMNAWGFTVGMMHELEVRFERFLKFNASDLTKVEFFLPDVVGDLIKEGRARVKVLPTKEKWFGMTYREDRPTVQAAIHELIERGAYPKDLWKQGGRYTQ
ncbi:MAG: nucleotidyltransferase [Armatimonadetes bacterium]|nr:nucleotidyltransferase [Armatimonadota bacterium]